MVVWKRGSPVAGSADAGTSGITTSTPPNAREFCKGVSACVLSSQSLRPKPHLPDGVRVVVVALLVRVRLRVWVYGVCCRLRSSYESVNDDTQKHDNKLMRKEGICNGWIGEVKLTI